MGDPAAEALLAGLDDEVGSVGSQDTTDTDSDTEAAIEEVPCSMAPAPAPAPARLLSARSRVCRTHRTCACYQPAVA